MLLDLIRNKIYFHYSIMAHQYEHDESVGTREGGFLTRREHFNYLRNNSCGMWGAFTWGEQQSVHGHTRGNHSERGLSKDAVNQQAHKGNNYQQKGHRRVSFDDGKESIGIKPPKANSPNSHNPIKQGGSNQKKKPVSAVPKRSKLVVDEEAEKQKADQNKQKVINYITELKPFSRELSNTKFQDYFGKAAPECYGRGNTNEPVGGVIYGNNLKTFNVNPHAYTNNPEFYQTHTTSLNFGKRAKICQGAKWKRLEKQLTKKLGLADKNETLKEGKQIVYVDVDDNNKYQVMRQNHEFQKANKQEIHGRELDYQKEKQQLQKDKVSDFYAKKKERIADNLQTRNSLDFDGSNLTPEDLQAKLNQQNIYRYHDKHGNVRLAADRHGMTCFVDMNFPENEAAYVEELKSRLQIYPIRAQGQDRNIDVARKQNCKKGHEQVYPSHYLLKNCDEPQTLKMLSNKMEGSGKKVGVNSPTGNKDRSFLSTNNSQGQR